MALTLVTFGALTTLWTAPESCLSTTTKWGDYRGYFLGYHQSIGIDVECYPYLAPTPTGSPVTSPLVALTTVTTGPTPTTFGAITGWTTIVPTPTSQKANLWPSGAYVSSIAYYSPGICPSGYEYAATFTNKPTSSSAESQYLCCPSGYTVYPYTSTRKLTLNGWVKTSWSTYYYYPTCSRTTSQMTNVWSMTSGWPTAKPTSYDLADITGSRTYVSFTAFASGIVVGWKETDTPVVDYLKASNISLSLSQGSGRSELNSSSGNTSSTRNLSKGSVAGIVVGSLVAGLGLLLIGCCLCQRRMRKRNDKYAMTKIGVATSLREDINSSPKPRVGPQIPTLPPVAITDSEIEQAPPRYEEAIASGK